MRIAVIGAGVGGLAAAVRLAAQGHRVRVFEAAAAPGGKCGRVERDGFAWDSGPSLVTMPRVFEALFAETGAPLADELELLPVEPVTRYAFADGSTVDLSADAERSRAALEAWSPGSGDDWARFLDTCAGLWRAAEPVLRGPAPWPPRVPPARSDPSPSPTALVRIRPWQTLRGLAAAHARDPRLRLVIERFATYAGADPRRAPAVLALAGYVEHAWGAWHPRGGVYAIVRALARRLEALGGELALATPVRRIVRDAAGRAAAGVETDAGVQRADVVVAATDAEAVVGRLLGRPVRPRERSLSGLALMLGLRGRTPDLVHHRIAFPADYDAEFDDVFLHRRPARDPTVYVSAPCATDPDDAPPDTEGWFVLVNAPAVGDACDWDAAAERVVDRLGVRDRLVARAVRSPADLERETGAVCGSIYGVAPHGRLGTLRRPGTRVRGVPGLWLVGGTVHPGGGLPLVALGAAAVAREIGAA
jgi:phytoene desaturase